MAKESPADTTMSLNNTIHPTPSLDFEALIVPVPVRQLLHYLRHPRDERRLDNMAGIPPERPSLPLGEEFLHINLGSEGIEEPTSPIEENLHVLQHAIQENSQWVPVFFSGQLERAEQAGLISGETLIRLRLHLMAIPSTAFED